MGATDRKHETLYAILAPARPRRQPLRPPVGHAQLVAGARNRAFSVPRKRICPRFRVVTPAGRRPGGREDNGGNAFALDRARLTVTTPLTQRLAVYAAVNADRLAWTEGEPPDTKLRVLVRNAWLELHAVPVGMRFRAGMVDTPFTSYSEHIVDTRFLTPSFGEEIGCLHVANVCTLISGARIAVQRPPVVRWRSILGAEPACATPQPCHLPARPLRSVARACAAGGAASLPKSHLILRIYQYQS